MSPLGPASLIAAWGNCQTYRVAKRLGTGSKHGYAWHTVMLSHAQPLAEVVVVVMDGDGGGNGGGGDG
jgi:hypothetical protein